MSARLEMLQVARLAPEVLGDATANVEAFLRQQLTPAGAGCDRAGAPDLYYTVFVLDGLHALRATPPAECTGHLQTHGDGDGLDLVHLACLARCWAAVSGTGTTPGATGLDPDTASALLDRIEGCRQPDGGYANGAAAASSTAYHTFLAVGAYQDLGRPLPRPAAAIAATQALRAADGAFANQPDMPIGSTTATAAAVTVLRHLGAPESTTDQTDLGPWLLARAHVDGGFVAAPRAPIPDLLSTATALHTLATLQVDFDPLVPGCLDFVDTLWTGRGFCGNWTDDAVDAEYTFYALLALGHLSVGGR